MEQGELKEWKSGRSDLDIKVYGDGMIPGEVKIEGVLLIEKLKPQRLKKGRDEALDPLAT